MSARMQAEQTSWAPSASEVAPGKRPSEVEVECLLRNVDEKNMVAPLREMQSNHRSRRARAGSEQSRQAALALQQQWESWLVQRELLRNEIKRGREFLEHVQQELTSLRGRLEDWPAYERICGRNPVLDYMEAITAQERVEHFLPAWLKRREAQLQHLDQQLEQCARQNGLEHLL